MKPLTVLLACLSMPGCAASRQDAVRQDPVPSAAMAGAAECEVWARETSFAHSVAAHDPAAFREHLDEGAVFGARSPSPQRGRDAIVEAWTGILDGIVDGSALALRWYPTKVAVDGSGELAYSTGPALYEKAGAQGPEYHVSTFHSVWRRGGDGVWHVVFDDGTRPQAATPEQVAAFRKEANAACPRG